MYQFLEVGLARGHDALARWPVLAALAIAAASFAAIAQIRGGDDTRHVYEMSGTPGAELSDAELQGAVEKALRRAPLIAADRIHVQVVGGVVTLSGSQPLLIAVDRALAFDSSSANYNVGIDVRDGVVTLTGKADDPFSRSRAEELAEAVRVCVRCRIVLS